MEETAESSGSLSRIEPRLLGLDDLFMAIRDAVVVGEASSGNIVLWNAGAARIFGYDEAEAITMRLDALVPEELRAQHLAGLAQYAATGEGKLIQSGQVVELPALRKDGTEAFVELTLTPLEHAEVPGRYVMAVVRDVTQRRHLETSLREALDVQAQAADRLRELDTFKDTLVATVAHDLRSPLAIIQTAGRWLRERWDDLDDDHRRELLGSIETNTDHLMRLARDLLDVAALEAGTFEIPLEPFDLGALVTRTAVELRGAGEDILIETAIEPDLPLALGNSERVWQVLGNLLSNAARYTPAGEAVEVAVRTAPDAVEVCVADRGPGIAPEDIPRLFEKFSRVGGSAERGRTRGTGLGLYICRSLIEAQGGAIWAESEPGHGTRFTFRLPARSAGSPPRP